MIGESAPPPTKVGCLSVTVTWVLPSYIDPAMEYPRSMFLRHEAASRDGIVKGFVSCQDENRTCSSKNKPAFIN